MPGARGAPGFDRGKWSTAHHLPKLNRQRIVEWGGGWFIADESLELYTAYEDHGLGDVIVVQGAYSGSDIFFEIAGRATQRNLDAGGWWLVRIDLALESDRFPVAEYPEGHPSRHPGVVHTLPPIPILEPKEEDAEETTNGGGQAPSVPE